MIAILDPKTNTATQWRAPVRDAEMPESLGEGHAATLTSAQPSAYWGEEKIWSQRVNNHNPMFDKEGRLLLTAAVRGQGNPAYCKKGSELDSAKLFPLEKSSRQLAMLDPKAMKYTFADVCFATHHLQFGFDANDTLWTSGGGPVVGWLNAKEFLATGDVEKSQGWTALILDTNGNGKRDEYVEPNQPVDPGAHPPETALTEIYNVPAPGFGPRGADIDSKGVVWVSLASGHLGSFDRKKCKGPLNGPKATGDQCPEGWNFYQYPGPGFAGIGENSAEASYYTWVDQHNTLGLGKDVPMSTANLMDGLVALKDGK